MIRSKYFITLLFLLFVFGSCGGVSFGMKENDNSEIKKKYYNAVCNSFVNINNQDKDLIYKHEDFLKVVSFLEKDPVNVSSE